MLRKGLLVAAAIGATAAVVTYGQPAQAMEKPAQQTIVSQLGGSTSPIVKTQSNGLTFNVAWSRNNGKPEMKVTQTAGGKMFPRWWGCPEVVAAAVTAVGYVAISWLVAIGGPLDLGFVVIGPETLALIERALGSISTLESVAAQFVC